MAGPIVCSECGARNPAEVAWCGQCFASLAVDDQPAEGDASIGQPPADTPPETVADDPVSPSSKTGSRVAGEGATWICRTCETANPLDEQECSACGTSIYASFGADEEGRMDADPQKALVRSIILPGLGHSYAGQGLLGAAIAGLTLMALGFGIALVVSDRSSFGWPLILVAVVVWVIAAMDAIRIAGGHTEGLLLRPRVVTGLVGLVMVALIVAAFTAQGLPQ
jgi:ribosomal protein L40E